MSNAPPPDLRAVMERFFALADKVKDAWETVGPEASATAPDVVIAAMRELRKTMEQHQALIELNEEGGNPVQDVSQLCAYGLQCLSDLSDTADAAQLPETARELGLLSFPFALSMTRLGAELMTLEPVVNAVALIANSVKEPAELAEIYRELTELVEAVSPGVYRDAERDMPATPWRLLLLNRAIVATRSHDPLLMEDAFETVTTQLPDEAERFFEEGMGQLDVIGYPDEVREVMTRYYHRYVSPKTIH